jgi:hypothetical protein
MIDSPIAISTYRKPSTSPLTTCEIISSVMSNPPGKCWERGGASRHARQ